MPSRGTPRVGMTTLQHADEDDGMPHRLPNLRVKTHQKCPSGKRLSDCSPFPDLNARRGIGLLGNLAATTPLAWASGLAFSSAR